MSDLEKTSDGVKCPSCGRYAGPFEICQHCQASLETRLSLRVVKWTAVAGSIIGLILLWAGVKFRDVPVVQIGEIDLQYNLAIAELNGTVLDARLDGDKNSFRITMDDGTGKAVLNGFGKLKMFQDVLKEDFPRTGDKISAVGNLNVSESWGVTMFMTSPRRLTLIERPEIKALTLGELKVSLAGVHGYFTGEVTSVTPFSKGRSIILKDATGEIQLTVFTSELEGCSDAVIEALAQPGMTISFLGRVESYRGRAQLRLIQPAIPENLKIEPQ